MQCRLAAAILMTQIPLPFWRVGSGKKRELPPCARHSWATAERIKASFI